MGEYDRGISLIEKAIAIDPDFATAFAALSMVYSNLDDNEKSREYIQKAMEITDRISEKERYIIQASFYQKSEKTYDKAIEACDKLLELYPDQINGNIILAQIYKFKGQNKKAIEIYERTIRYRSAQTSTVPFTNLAQNYFSVGSYDKAEEMLKDYEKTISNDKPSIKWFLAWTFLFQKKYELALAEIEKSIALLPSDLYYHAIKGDICLFSGDLKQAEIEYNEFLDDDNLHKRLLLGAFYLLQGNFAESETQIEKGLELQHKQRRYSSVDFNLRLAYLNLRKGNSEKALELCNEAVRYAVANERLVLQRRALHLKGIALLGMNSVDEALRTIDELNKMAEESPNEKEMGYFYHLLGMIELEKKNFSKSIEYFQNALLLLDSESHLFDDQHALFIDPMAFTYYISGDLEKARQEYEKIISLTYGRLFYGDIYAKSIYMLGKIYEEKGWGGKAIEHYEKFLDLWKDADPEIAAVTDAKMRLAGLKEQ
jgi:tetratricopeptide (TPR) repeat protein